MNNVSINDARKIVESWRYKYSTEAALHTFIRHWAYHLSEGLYPCNDPIVSEKPFIEGASALSQVIASLILDGDETDVLGILLSEFSGASKQYDFYPTPASLVALLNSLVVNEKHMDVDESAGPECSIYEPCSGTIGIVYQQMERICQAHTQSENPLALVEITLEDVNPIAVHAAFIQMVLYIMKLKKMYGDKVTPKRITIECKDVISQRKFGILYVLECLN